MRSAGALVRRVAKDIEASGFAVSQESVGLLNEVVDDDFREVCRIAVVGRRLVVNVNRESLVYPMRMRWQVPLTDVLARYRSRLGLHGVVFDFGKAGVRLGIGQTNTDQAGGPAGGR